MKCIIAGSNNVRSQFKIFDILNNFQKFYGNITHIISTGERGIDHFAMLWANNNKIPVTVFYPDPVRGLRKGRFVRNQRMIDHIQMVSGALIIIKDGKSKGSKNLIDKAWESDIKIYEFKIEE